MHLRLTITVQPSGLVDTVSGRPRHRAQPAGIVRPCHVPVEVLTSEIQGVGDLVSGSRQVMPE